MENIHAARIASLRSLMDERGWDAVVITGSDPHASEYPAYRWKCVEWLTGFTGEAGDIVITEAHAGLWTDSRYFIQADRQLSGTGVVLHKTRLPESIPIPIWLSGQFPFGGVVAIDGLCQSRDAVTEIRMENPDLRIISVPDLISLLWTDRPVVPQTPVITLGEDITGESRAEKLEWFRREAFSTDECEAAVICALDDIAWLLNVRGQDVEYNPVVISYLVVTEDSAEWFVIKNPGEEVDEDTLAAWDEVAADGVQVREYSAIDSYLGNLAKECSCVLADGSSLNYHLSEVIENSGAQLRLSGLPVSLRKAEKNPVEIEGFRHAHKEDGAAMEMFLFWLERNAGMVDEWVASRKLGEFRAKLPGYMGDSFETISAYGPGAALPHYSTPRQNAPVIERHGLYLVDSGGQFLFGTTDITRTVPMGPLTELEKEDYTAVLKGHIDLAMAVFPAGTPGSRLDALAREPLWRLQRDYGHGTGHGVGSFLCVHEGPQSIRQNMDPQPLVPGMVTSDEPGIYREGMHGVRHENLLLCVDMGTNQFGHWLGFETLTLCHFDTSAIIREMLSPDEIDWLNAYNERVYESHRDVLPPAVSAWLREKTRPI